jgi:hypothetical protein
VSRRGVSGSRKRPTRTFVKIHKTSAGRWRYLTTDICGNILACGYCADKKTAKKMAQVGSHKFKEEQRGISRGVRWLTHQFLMHLATVYSEMERARLERKRRQRKDWSRLNADKVRGYCRKWQRKKYQNDPEWRQKRNANKMEQYYARAGERNFLQALIVASIINKQSNTK